MRIGYIGAFVPGGSNAPSLRVLGVATALKQAGHDVTLVPLLGSSRAGAWFPSRDEVPFAVDGTVARTYKGGSLSNAVDTVMMGRRAARWAKGPGRRFDCLIMYNTPASFLLPVVGWAGSPPLVLDVVEWYDYRHMRGGPLGPYAAEHALAMNWLALRPGHAICISTYLAQHFASHGTATLVVPPLMPRMPNSMEFYDSAGDDSIRIVYAGHPGQKDGPGLSTLLRVMKSMPSRSGRRLELTIAGLTLEQARGMWGKVVDHLGECTVHFLGRLPVQEVRSLVKSADFSFLWRPQHRYAMAGFPTKVAESLVLGTPVIANLTSDLGRYLSDGRNAVVLEGGPSESADAAIRRALERIADPGFELALTHEEIAAQATALFAPDQYRVALDQFITSTVAR